MGIKLRAVLLYREMRGKKLVIVLCANVEEKMLLQDFREALQNYPFQKQEGAN